MNNKQETDLLIFFVNSTVPLPESFDQPMPADCIVALPAKRAKLRQAYLLATSLNEQTSTSASTSAAQELIIELEPAGNRQEQIQDCLRPFIKEVETIKPDRLFILNDDLGALAKLEILAPLTSELEDHALSIICLATG
ncbi:MAG: hypothetical protein LCH63_01555 [Candidatus Melainabacteria bacterium]|nr:hypothetical protein [Candidatus Melainabacteria bacterium]